MRRLEEAGKTFQAKSLAWAQSLFPPLCVICRRSFSKAGEAADICPTCMSDLPWRRREEAILPILSNRLSIKMTQDEFIEAGTVKVLVPLYYSGEIPHLIRRLKFHGHLETARPLADLMVMAVKLHPLMPFDTIVSVPLHPQRLRERGYNQTGELSKIIAEGLGVPDLSFAMRRVVHTMRQSELAYDLRIENLRNAFLADPHVLARRHILLVDDILTSGATLWSAVQAARTAGAASVTGLVAASGRNTEIALST